MKHGRKLKNQLSKRDGIVELWLFNASGCGRILDKLFVCNNDYEIENEKDDKLAFPPFCNYDCGNDCWKNPSTLTIVPYFFGLKSCITPEAANSYFVK